ncbi:MAG: CusA/CzcA family heavy metal efflux RND transporter [Bacteroidetes bacterium]|nr:CusA/CzcA family heavy metal efflux RND transporter [Bacteroidota bacterium]
MLTKIIGFSIKNKLIIGLLVIGLIIFGVYELKRLPVDAVPDITNNQVQLITVAPALGANDVERLITFPIEQANSNIPGLKELRSFSRFGLSIVTMVFEDDIDTYWARQQISERLQQIQEQIPKGLGTTVLAPVSTGLGEIYQYAVRAKKGYEHKYNAMELRTIQDWIVRRQLLGVKGVAEVSSFGGFLKQYEIAVEPANLLSHNITINDIYQSLENNNQNTGGSYIEKGPTLLYIRSEGLAGSISDIENMVITTLSDGTPLRIRDVAKVNIGAATRYGAMTYNGESQVAGAVVLMLKGANSKEVIQNIKERIAQINKMLPEGIIIDAFLDRTKMVNNAINTVTKNLTEGALIVVFVLVLFLGNFRAGFLVASVIPLSMLFAVIMMNLFGVSGNLMSLGALDFGLIVDGAVIIVEAVMHRLSHSKHFLNVNRLTQTQMDAEVQDSASRMMTSAVFGQIIILLVYLPIFSLHGIEGKMFKPMAQTVAFSLAGAFLLSLTYIPVMSTLFLQKNISHQPTFSDKWMYRLERFYQSMLIKSIRNQKQIILSVILLLAGAGVLLTQLGGEFMPKLPEGDFAVEVRVLSGSNLGTSIDAVSKASKLLLNQFPEIEKIVTKTGNSEIPTDPMPIDASDMIVVLKGRKEWTSGKTYEELETKMSDALKDIPGVNFSFQYPVAMRFNELISGARQDVVCKIFGDNLDTLSAYGQRLGNICNAVQGSSGLYVETVSGLPQIVVKYNRAAMAQYGLNINHVNNVINAAFAGQSAGMVYEGEKRFDLVVRLAGEKRKNLSDVQHLLIATPQGKQIPLYAVADIVMTEGVNQIQRENSHRRIMVGFNVRGRDVQSMVHELQQRVAQQIKLPVGYYITYGGAFENLEAAKSRLYVAVPVALVLIFLMLFFAFGSVRQSWLIYSAIPLSAIGGVFALGIRGMSFSISAGVGFIALFGVAVLNGIVLVGEFNRLKASGMKDLRRIVMMGTKVRLRPVLMTAFVASLGFLPMAISTGEGAEVQRPLATVVIGGLLIATFLTLFVLPILYILFERNNMVKLKSIPKNTLVITAIFFFSTSVHAQTPISLQAAIDTALKNNLSVKTEKLRADYQKILIRTSKDIPPTNFVGEYGQINSFYRDAKLGFSQAIQFPNVYATKNALLTQEWKHSFLGIAVREKNLKKEVATLYYELLYLQKKRKLFMKIDSLYSEYYKRAVIRLRSGETNILEKITADNQRNQAVLQLSQLEKDMQIVQLKFQLLLNTDTTFFPSDQVSAEAYFTTADTMMPSQHPTLIYAKQKTDMAIALTNLEKSKRFPELNVGYNIMGMRGVGADNILYDRNLRFQSVQLGLGVPLFTQAIKAKISAAKLNETITRMEYDANLKSFNQYYRSVLLEYKKYTDAVHFYETVGLNNAETIIKTADAQFAKGEINYLEWVMLMNESVKLQSEYVETVYNRDKMRIELNFLKTNK